MEFLIGFVFGLFSTGLFVYFIHKRKKPSGSFVIDFSDPMKDVCRLELDESIDSIYEKKRVVLNIKTISQQ